MRNQSKRRLDASSLAIGVDDNDRCAPYVNKLTFVSGGAFLQDVRRDVDIYVRENRRRALRALYAKTLLIFSLLIGSWASLVFARPGSGGIVLAVGGLFAGFLLTSLCIFHDSNHGVFFKSSRRNDLLGWTADIFLGAGSYAWRVKHNVAHHTYPNVDGYDDDIAQAPLARLAPSQPTRSWYRWQHLYIWLLYALLILRWHVGSDIAPFLRGRIGSTRLHRPRGWHLAGVIIGKALFLLWAFVIPMLVYAWWTVVLTYVAFAMLGGVLMTLVFQLAHCVEDVDFVVPEQVDQEQREWAVHEVQSTSNFCPNSRMLTYCIGSLNYQIEHHLFPKLPHTLYPEIAPIVRRHAEAHGVRYTLNPTLRSALSSHYRHLRKMGELGVPAEIEMG